MRKPLLKARQLLLLAYLLAAVLWMVRCLVGCGVMLNYKLQGKMPQTHVDAADETPHHPEHRRQQIRQQKQLPRLQKRFTHLLHPAFCRDRKSVV